MTRYVFLLVTVAAQAALAITAPAAFADPDVGGEANGDQIWMHAVENAQGSQHEGGTAVVSAPAAAKYVSYDWLSVCQHTSPNVPQGNIIDCAAANNCPDPAQSMWRLWGQRANGDWDPLYTQCLGTPPDVVNAPDPQVTPAMVLNALRRIGLPALEAQTQPAEKTLVNFDTIFFAEPQTFTRTLTLLGQRVEVEAAPSSFLWHHGDGTTTSTQTAGAPYPAKDITYQYTDAHITVLPSVDVTYTARFRVNGGAWQDIGETVTISGPAGNLRVSEARPVLSGDYG